jgi:hypothetical protein
MWALAGAVPGQHIEVSFELPPHGVSFGEPFAVTVQRSWAGGEPAPFDDKALAPLSVQLEEAVPLPASGDSGTHAGERRRYRARAFMVGEVRIPAIEFRHRGEVATCTPAPFVVKSVLPEPPGEMEWPGDLRQWPRRGSWHWWVAALVAALLGGVWWWRRPAPAAAEPERVRQPPAHELTFAELAALALPDQHDVAVDAFYAALAEIVRGHTQRRFSLPAQVRTSQEIVAAVPIGTTPLQRCLLACDVVKFGALRPAREAHALARQQAEAFVMATVVAAPASQVQAP